LEVILAGFYFGLQDNKLRPFYSKSKDNKTVMFTLKIVQDVRLTV